jgi:acyl-coenzyme A synthetase/AMP-(fatty) acid ligase
MWGALLTGGRLVVVPYRVSRSADAFYELVEREGVTVMGQTPSAFNQFILAEQAIRSKRAARALRLRQVILGGEALDVRRLRAWYQMHEEGGPELINMYGITETTVHTTYEKVSKKDVEASLWSVIGEPIPDMQVYIVDGNGSLAPVGVTGEIYVGGAGLGRCYVGRSELTAERFTPSRYGGVYGERVYRSGDMGRWREDGKIEYVGRGDQQVKVRGFRIELGEIEAALRQYDAVRDAAVTIRQDDLDDTRLVAYVVPKLEATINISELRDFVSEKLPNYMTPHSFIVLDEFPLTVNGKLDYKALPDPDDSRPDLERAYVAPRTPEEEVIAGLWAKQLRVDRVGMFDDFFELGGHSVLATKLLTEVNLIFNTEIDLRVIFETPTVDSMAKEIQKAKSAQPTQKEPEIRPVSRQARSLKRNHTKTSA